jgi:hypothetical protein
MAMCSRFYSPQRAPILTPRFVNTHPDTLRI